MKKLNLLFLLLLPLVALKAQDTTETINRIFWSNRYQLKGSDFQAAPDEERKVAALSSLGLPYSSVSDGEGAMTIYIQTCFTKISSWSKKEQQNNVLLQHEQLHFDVAELYRRKIIKKILETNFFKENCEEKLKEIITKIRTNEYRKSQDKYDRETNYSRVFKKQIDWNKYIEQELKNYEDYRNRSFFNSLRLIIEFISESVNTDRFIQDVSLYNCRWQFVVSINKSKFFS